MPSLWEAVNIAKDLHANEIPLRMHYETLELKEEDVVDSFASHFESKITSLLTNVNIEPEVYNGSQRIHCHHWPKNFIYAATHEREESTTNGLREVQISNSAVQNLQLY